MRSFETLDAAVQSEERMAYIVSKNGMKLFARFGGPGLPASYYVVSDPERSGDLEVPDVPNKAVIQRLVHLPQALLAKTIALFRRVYKEHHSEMVVILCWVDGRYGLFRPKCGVIGGGHLNFLQGEDLKGVVGTIHSHHMMGSFFSGTDDRNEKMSAGTYYVFGRILDKQPSLSASITGLGKRFTFKPPAVPTEIPDISDDEYKWWMEPFQILSEVRYKTTGFYLVDQDNDILRWSESKEELDAMAERSTKVVKAIEHRPSYVPPVTVARTWTPNDYSSRTGYFPAPITTKKTYSEKHLQNVLTYISKKVGWGEFLDFALSQLDGEDRSNLVDAIIDTAGAEDGGKDEDDDTGFDEFDNFGFAGFRGSRFSPIGFHDIPPDEFNRRGEG